MGKRFWEWDPAFELDPARAALLVIDMQNGFVEPGAPLEVPTAAYQVSTIRNVIDACRVSGVPVAFTKFTVDEDFNYEFYWRMASQRGLDVGGERREFAPETHEAQIVPQLEPSDGEPVFEKCGYDGFAGTKLEGWLGSNGCDQLVLCGTVVNWCVDSTVRASFHRGYETVVLADVVSGYDHAGLTAQQWVDAELDLFAEAFARVVTSDDFVAAVRTG